jgi:ferrochelatase
VFKKTIPFEHGKPARIGVLLVQLGTPQAPTSKAVRRYLKQFLSDPRVIEIPRFLWLPILHGIILRIRPAKSAKKYASIWVNSGMEQGSPLRLYSEKQTKLLRGYLGNRGIDVEVALAMRYGTPSISEVMAQLAEKSVDRLLIVPLYPQYSATTTASVYDAVMDALKSTRNIPELRFIKHWHDHSGYIEALAKSVRSNMVLNGEPELLVMSFHGMPKRNLLLGDPYYCECQKTARLVAERLGWPMDRLKVTFQSRHIAVMCPAFISDCLETLEEINQEVRNAFMAAGGRKMDYIPCLNDDAKWLEAFTDIVQMHLSGWLENPRPPAKGPKPGMNL